MNKFEVDEIKRCRTCKSLNRKNMYCMFNKINVIGNDFCMMFEKRNNLRK